MNKKFTTKNIDNQNKASKDIINDIVDDIYNDDTDNTLVKPQRKYKINFIFYIIFVAIIAILGGIVGELMINNYLYHTGNDMARIWEPVNNNNNNDQQVIVFKKESIEAKDTSQIKLLVETATPAVVGIYQKRGGSALVDQIYRSTDKIGNALVLTNDGWLATTATGMPIESGKELVIITHDNKILPIEKIVLDEASQIVFIKVTAENLKVVQFASESNVYTGLSTILISQTINSQIAKVITSDIDQIDYRRLVGFADNFQSTEKYSTFITIKDKLDKTFAGSPVVDNEGAIIGLYLEDGVVIPADHFVNTFNDFLRYGEIDRPYVGIKYIDLAHTIGLPQNISEGLSTGALVFGDRDHGITAVSSDSPAVDAGIVYGDIITKVNNDPVDVKYSLTELIQQYKVGDVVKLTIQNTGVVREVDLVLVGE